MTIPNVNNTCSERNSRSDCWHNRKKNRSKSLDET